MSNLDTFYKKLISEMKILMEEKKYEEAYVLIKDEITSSYIPLEYVDEIEKLYSVLMREIDLSKYAKRFEMMSKEQLLNSLMRNGKVDFDSVIFLLTKFGGLLDKNDFKYFEEIFNSGMVINSNKIAVLNELFLSGIENKFEFYNVNTEKHFKTNTIEEMHPNTGYYASVRREIKNIMFKEPSLLNSANDIVDSFYWYYFDETIDKSVPKYNEKELANIICNYIKHAFGQISDDKDVEVVSNVLEEKKLFN